MVAVDRLWPTILLGAAGPPAVDAPPLELIHLPLSRRTRVSAGASVQSQAPCQRILGEKSGLFQQYL